VPTYDYQCRSCGHTIEVIHSMLESGPATCDRCGGELRRILYPAGIIFKGSGFYKTDSRASGSGGGTATAAANTKSEGSGAASDGTSGDGSSAASPTPAPAESVKSEASKPEAPQRG
jgi:putative FmdB family regulatory protein